jgi:quercetin dioxygenase-like cupin family protein
VSFVHNRDQKQVNEGEGIFRKLLAKTEKLMMVEYFLPKGSYIPDHDHPHEQVSYIVSGRWTVKVGNKEDILGRGDSMGVPSNALHSVEILEDTVAIDVFTPHRKEFIVPFGEWEKNPRL